MSNREGAEEDMGIISRSLYIYPLDTLKLMAGRYPGLEYK